MTKRILAFITMLLLVAAGAWADDYNPQNPPDPSALFKLTVSASPSEAGYVSGSGRYNQGRQVWVSTSSRVGYDFQYWECDGERISNERSFYYTMPQKSVELIAVYAFNPTNPADPTTKNAYRLYLDTNMEGSCTFNITSGLKQQSGQYIAVSVQNVGEGFRFLGWYEDEMLVNENLSFWYKMPTSDATLNARFEYNPDSPNDPTSAGQDNIDNTPYTLGDVNGDNDVNVIDVVTAIDFILMKNPSNFIFNAADVNVDGTVNVVDVVGIIDIILGRWTPAPIRRAASDNTSGDQLRLIQNADQSLSLCLENQGQYVAAQFDLMLKDGQTLTDAIANQERAAGFQVSYSEIEPGFYRMLLFTMNNQAIRGEQGEIVNFKIAGGTNGVRIENAQLVTTDREPVQFGTLVITRTGIREISSSRPVDIYSPSGHLIKRHNTGTTGLRKGLYIINDTKTIVR